METQLPPPGGLWVHTQGVQITAQNHEVWYFTPDFLQESGSMLDGWICTRHTRDGDRVVIESGPVRWTMTETSLWIQNYLEQPWDEEFVEYAKEIPRLCGAFLRSQPLLAVKRMWFGYVVSAQHPQPAEWIASRFAPVSTSPLLPHITSEPRITLADDTSQITLNIRESRQHRGGERPVSTVLFDSRAQETRELSVEEMIESNGRWSHWSALTAHAINLAIGGEENDR